MKDLTTEIEDIRNDTNIITSATAFINGSADRTQAAVDAALANGATAEQLQPVIDVIAEQRAAADQLAAAIAANTPAAPAVG